MRRNPSQPLATPYNRAHNHHIITMPRKRRKPLFYWGFRENATGHGAGRANGHNHHGGTRRKRGVRKKSKLHTVKGVGRFKLASARHRHHHHHHATLDRTGAGGVQSAGIYAPPADSRIFGVPRGCTLFGLRPTPLPMLPVASAYHIGS